MSKGSNNSRRAPVESKNGKHPEPARVFQIDGANIESVIVTGEKWVSPAEHQIALDEIERLKNIGALVCEPNEIKPHLRCPACWGRDKGKAGRRKWQRQVNGPLVKRCYACDECGAEWVVEVRSDECNDGVLFVSTRVTEVRQSV